MDVQKLDHGSHRSADEGMCLLEACAYISGEPHTDHPRCVDVALAAFGRAVNDSMNDDERVMLLPFVSKLVGTAADHTVSLRRSMLIVDGLVRQILPQIFDDIGLGEHAGKMRALSQICDANTASAAASAAWSAARSAADSATRSAESAARSADSAAWSAESAARSADRAAWSAESAARRKVWEQVLALFSAAIDLR